MWSHGTDYGYRHNNIINNNVEYNDDNIFATLDYDDTYYQDL